MYSNDCTCKDCKLIRSGRTDATVAMGPAYAGPLAWHVENPDGQRFIPGRTVLVVPPHEEAPSWRAILAGLSPDHSTAYVVPLDHHFGELRVRRLTRGLEGLGLSKDEPVSSDEVSWAEAKTLALSVAYAFGLIGGDRYTGRPEKAGR